MTLRTLHRFLSCARGAAAVEAAIVTPLLLIVTAGTVDLGVAMFDQAAVNAAAQAGAASAIINGDVSGVQSAMDAAANGLTITASPSIAGCADGSPECVTVSASYAFTPLLLRTALTSWVPSTFDLSATITVRIK